MVGNLDGSIETMMDPSVTLVGTGKPESKASGMDVQIFLVRSVRISLLPFKIPDLDIGTRLIYIFLV